jgi:hypothetical protein
VAVTLVEAEAAMGVVVCNRRTDIHHKDTKNTKRYCPVVAVF